MQVVIIDCGSHRLLQPQQVLLLFLIEPLPARLLVEKIIQGVLLVSHKVVDTFVQIVVRSTIKLYCTSQLFQLLCVIRVQIIAIQSALVQSTVSFLVLWSELFVAHVLLI